MSIEEFGQCVAKLFRSFAGFLYVESPVRGVTVLSIVAGSVIIALSIRIIRELFADFEGYAADQIKNSKVPISRATHTCVNPIPSKNVFTQ